MARIEDQLTLPSGLVPPHRIVKAAMTENLADGQLMVDRRYLERSRNIVADGHLDVPRLARIREAAGASPVLAQVNHPGRQTNRFVASRPLAPSTDAGAVRMAGLFGRPRELDDSGIRHGGFTEDQAEQVVRLLVEEGVDRLEISGGTRSRATMEALLEDGGEDLIGPGRPLAIDPDRTARLLDGGDGTPLPRYRLPTVAGLAGESE